MSTLFESFYDSLGYELFNGSTVMAKTAGYFIYGHVIDMTMDNKGEKYTVIPDIGYRSNKKIILKRKYKINWKNIFLISVKK